MTSWLVLLALLQRTALLVGATVAHALVFRRGPWQDWEEMLGALLMSYLALMGWSAVFRLWSVLKARETNAP